MSQQSTATIEDYKKYVKELKLRIKQLTDKNKVIGDELKRYETQSGHKMKQNIVSMSVKLTKKAVIIQKFVRRFLARKQFSKKGGGKGAALYRPPERKEAVENEVLLTDMLKGCERLGMNLEMLFRAADQTCANEVSVETFKSFLQRLKLGLSRSDIGKFLYLVDEDGTGVITREEYCSTLSAFGVSSEAFTTEIAKRFLYTTLQNFHELLVKTGLVLEDCFPSPNIPYAEFLRFVTTKLESNHDLLKEKEKHMLINHFDRKKRGFIDRRLLINETGKITGMSDARSYFHEEAVERTEAMSHGKGSIRSTRQAPPQQIISNPKVPAVEQGEGPLFRAFIQAFERNKQTLQPFFDIFASFLDSHRDSIFGNSVSFSQFQYFLSKNFGSLFSSEFVESFCGMLQQGNQGKKPFKLKPSGLNRPSSNYKVPSQYQREQGFQGSQDMGSGIGTNDDTGLPQLLNITEFKNKLISYSNNKPDTSNLLKVLLVIKLEQQGVSTTDYFKGLGLNPRQKIDFSQFFIFGQKALEANFQEISVMFERFEPGKEGLISVAPLISEIDALRASGQPLISVVPKPQCREAEQELEVIKKKLALQSLNSIDVIIEKIKIGCLGVLKQTEQSTGLGKPGVKEVIGQEEMQRLITNVDNGNSPHIALHELLDFVLQTFSAKEDLLDVYLKVVAGFLDKSEAKTSTEEYLKRFKLHPQGFYDQLIFGKKIRQVFGLTSEHSQMFVEAFVDPETDSVSIQEFISAINRFRKVHNFPINHSKKEPESSRRSEAKEPKQQASANKENSKKTEPEPPKALSAKIKEHQPVKKAPIAVARTPSPNSETEQISSKAKNDRDHSKGSPKSVKKDISKEKKKEKVSPKKQRSPSPVNNGKEESFELRRDSSGMDRLSLDQLAAKLQITVEEKIHEAKYLDQIITSSEPPALNLVYLQRVLKPIFTTPEVKLFTSFFKKCDTHKNGLLVKAEWEKFAQKAGLRKEKKEIALSTVNVTIETEKDFWDKALKDLSEHETVPLDLLNEFLDYKNKPISILLIKHITKLYFGHDIRRIDCLMKLMRFLDFDCNGGFNFTEIRFTILMMNLGEIESEKIAVDGKLLRRLGLDEEKIKAYGRHMPQKKLQKVKTSSKEAASNRINLFAFAKHALAYFCTDSLAVCLLNFITIVSNKHASFDISYVEFLEEIGLLEYIRKFEGRLRSSPSRTELFREIHALRKQTVSSVPSGPCKKVSLAALSPVLRLALQTDRFSTEDKEDFDLFIAFVELDETVLKKSFKEVSSTDLAKQQQKMADLVEAAKTKIKQASIQSKDFAQGLTQVLNGRSVEALNFIEFKAFLENFKLGFKEEFVYALFTQMDAEKKGKVQVDVLRRFFDVQLKESVLQKEKSLQEAKKPKESKGADSEKQPVQLNSWEVDVLKYLKSVELKPSDLYLGKKTITNDIVSALKIAVEFIEKLASISGSAPKFEDPEFGPSKEDPHGQRAIYFEEVVAGMVDPEEIAWLRPEAISKRASPMFLDAGASCNDVIQGMLGDCWFISALSILATNDNYISEELTPQELKSPKLGDASTKKLVSGVYPKIFHFLQKYGIYVMRFFKDYAWRFVIIDDRLPCFDGNPDEPDLIFARCDKRNEFWVPLIEKAYAKIHGTYQALISGQIDDGLVDMTGCVSDKLRLKLPNNAFDAKTLISPENLWDRLNADILNGSMMGCSIVGEGIEGKVRIEGEFIGLISGHAYSVLDLVNIGTHKLVRIRNPWGSAEPIEWNGAWSDNSNELIQNIDKINKEIKARWKGEAEIVDKESKDGCFFMEYGQFLDIWHNVAISKNFADEYSGIRFIGDWNASNSGGTPYTNKQELFTQYLINPQFIMHIKGKKEVNIFLSLGQEDGRVKSQGAEPFPFGSHIHPISLSVFSLKDGEAKLTCFDAARMKNGPFIKNYRDVQLSLKLPPGKYCVIPSTKQTGSFGRFFLNFYFDCPKADMLIDDVLKVFKGQLIAEEEEDTEKFDDKLKHLLHNILLNCK